MTSTFHHIVIFLVVNHVTLYLDSKFAYYSGAAESILQLRKPNVQTQSYNNHKFFSNFYLSPDFSCFFHL